MTKAIWISRNTDDLEHASRGVNFCCRVHLSTTKTRWWPSRGEWGSSEKREAWSGCTTSLPSNSSTHSRSPAYRNCPSTSRRRWCRRRRTRLPSRKPSRATPVSRSAISRTKRTRAVRHPNNKPKFQLTLIKNSPTLVTLIPIYQYTPILVTPNISFGKVINVICSKIGRQKAVFTLGQAMSL